MSMAFLRSCSGGSIDVFGEPRRRMRDEVEAAIEPRKGEATSGDSEEEEDRWSRMLPELMVDIIGRVEASEERWPLRKNVVSCACVCRRWREITTGVVGSTRETGRITFPSSLKQPGPSDLPIQCFIRRNKNTSTFYLYLSLAQTFMEKGKFLLAARRVRHGYHTEYVISLDADDLSQDSNAYMGKLSSNFTGTKFVMYDSRPPFAAAAAAAAKSSSRRLLASKRISPQVGIGNFVMGQISYKFNLLKSRGPRRMLCTLLAGKPAAEDPPLYSAKTAAAKGGGGGGGGGGIVLKNKAPRWHDHLQCWCLNFHGRVTVASVKNFQLVATGGSSSIDEETVLLQFGKVGDDLFTMDYREPLSAFQAFAICLTSFGTKLACE